MQPPEKNRARIVRCPGCGGASRYALDNPHRPFCSERCRLQDLGAWASENYRVAKPPGGDDDADETPPDSLARH